MGLSRATKAFHQVLTYQRIENQWDAAFYDGRMLRPPNMTSLEWGALLVDHRCKVSDLRPFGERKDGDCDEYVDSFVGDALLAFSNPGR